MRRSVDGERVEDAVDREGVDGHLRAVDVAPRRCRHRSARRSIAASIAAGELVLGAHERQPALALAVGRLDDARRPARRPPRSVDAAQRGCGTPAAAKRSRCATWTSRAPRSPRRSDAEAPSRAATRAATPTGQSMPGRDDPVDALGAGEAVDRRLVLGRDDRPPVRVARSRAPTGSRSTAITKSSRSRAARAARAARAPRLGRGDAVARGSEPRHQASFSRYQATVCSSPSLEARSRRASRSAARASRSSRCGGRPGPAARRRRPSATSACRARRAPRRRCRATEMSTPVATFTPRRDRVDVRRDDRLDRLGVVVDVEPVAARVAVAVDRQRLVRRAPA